MRRIKLIISIFAIISALVIVFYMLRSGAFLHTHPIGRSELDLMNINIIFMVVVVMPTLILLFFVSWKHHAKNLKDQHELASFGAFGELILWIIPLVIIIVLAIITWGIVHNWQPNRSLESEPFTVHR